MPVRPERLKALLTPVLLGVLLGAVIWTTREPPESEGSGRAITVTPAEVAHLQARWQRENERPPTPEELRGAVDSFVRDEVFYREALARGLDRSDPTVRLTLIRKMKLLAAGQADTQVITVEKLLEFYGRRQEEYRIPARFSVVQVCFTNGADPGRAPQQAEALLEQFQRQEPEPDALAEAGDVTPLEQLILDVTAPELEERLGTVFAAAVLPLPENTWSGPIPSEYGLHLVKIINRIPSRIPMLYEVRPQVEADLRSEFLKTAEDQAYQEIGSRYPVLIRRDARRLLEDGAP